MTSTPKRRVTTSTLTVLFVVLTGAAEVASAHTARVYEFTVTIPARSFPEFKSDPWAKESQGNQISGVVRVMHQDSRGWYWFGTQNGLARYDGSWLVYFDLRDVHDQGVVVYAIAEGHDGEMWFGTSGGLTLYDGETFTTWTDRDGLVDTEVWSLFVDDANTLWIGTLEGANRFDGDRFSDVALPPGEKNPGLHMTSATAVRSITQDRAGRIWIVGEGRVHRIKGDNVQTLDVLSETSTTFVASILPDDDGGVWLAAGPKGLLHFDGENVTTVFARDGVPVGGLCRSSDGAFWFTSQGVGGCRFDGSSLTMFTEADGLQSHVPFQIIEDDRQRMWFVGLRGVNRYDGDSLVNVTREGPW